MNAKEIAIVESAIDLLQAIQYELLHCVDYMDGAARSEEQLEISNVAISDYEDTLADLDQLKLELFKLL